MQLVRCSICCLLSQDPNQLIRGSALRVLSSIRVPVIAPIMMLAIKEVSKDDFTLLFFFLERSNCTSPMIRSSKFWPVQSHFVQDQDLLTTA